jgi:hypothetical protein
MFIQPMAAPLQVTLARCDTLSDAARDTLNVTRATDPLLNESESTPVDMDNTR